MRRRELKAAAVDLGERVGVMNDAVGKNNSKGAPYSPAIRVDSKDALLFVSGQLPLNHGSGEIESTSVGGQTKVVLCATHQTSLKVVALEDLKAHAVDLN